MRIKTVAGQPRKVPVLPGMLQTRFHQLNMELVWFSASRWRASLAKAPAAGCPRSPEFEEDSSDISGGRETRPYIQAGCHVRARVPIVLAAIVSQVETASRERSQIAAGHTPSGLHLEPKTGRTLVLATAHPCTIDPGKGLL